MLSQLRINTATFICLAFIFRLLFINAGFASSLVSTHSHSSKKRVSANVKRRKTVEVSEHSREGAYTAPEICEETSTDNDEVKLNPYFLIQFFYSRVENKLKDTLKKITPFNKHFSFDSSDRYLEYRVFRI